MRLICDRDQTEGPRVLVLGMFDGVHAGHRALIRTAKAEAGQLGIPLQVCTFDPHPLRVVRPQTAPKLLHMPEEKAEVMGQLGVDELRVIRFSEELAGMSPEKFLELLCSWSRPAAVHVGWNYTFGRGGTGNAGTLEAAGEAFGFRTRVHPPVRAENGMTVSSSVIRSLLLQALADEAAVLLEEPYPVTGTAMETVFRDGETERNGLGILLNEWKLMPKDGLYNCEAETKGAKWKCLVRFSTGMDMGQDGLQNGAWMQTDSRVRLGDRIRMRVLRAVNDSGMA